MDDTSSLAAAPDAPHHGPGHASRRTGGGRLLAALLGLAVGAGGGAAAGRLTASNADPGPRTATPTSPREVEESLHADLRPPEPPSAGPGAPAPTDLPSPASTR